MCVLRHYSIRDATTAAALYRNEIATCWPLFCPTASRLVFVANATCNYKWHLTASSLIHYRTYYDVTHYADLSHIYSDFPRHHHSWTPYRTVVRLSFDKAWEFCRHLVSAFRIYSLKARRRCAIIATHAFGLWRLCTRLDHRGKSLHCALSLAAQCIVIGSVCVFVCGFVTTITRNCLQRSSPNWVCRWR